MASASIIEKFMGTAFVKSHIYGAWWFSLLWALLVSLGVVYYLKHRSKAWSALLLHFSFAVIILGAFITHVSAEQGQIHIRQGVYIDNYTLFDGGNRAHEAKLPFKIRLDKFDVLYHSGTDAVQDYISRFTISDNNNETKGRVSMNSIFNYGSIRFCQASYDSDMLGATLSTNSDPWGIKVTYTGYALLFISLVAMLFDPRGTYRKILSSSVLKKGALCIVAFFCLGSTQSLAQTANVLPQNTASKFGDLLILYNNRVCPVQTFAIDFTKKIYGSSSYKGLTPEQVLTGWIFWGNEWMNEPMIKIKGGEIKERLQLPDYVPANQFFNADMGGYTIGPYLNEYFNGNHDKFHSQIAEVDEVMQLLMDVQRGNIIKMLPYTYANKTTWYAPTDALPNYVSSQEKHFIQYILPVLSDYAHAGETDKIDELISNLHTYQSKNGAKSIPSDKQIDAEHMYNNVPFSKILFIICLAMGFLTFVYTIIRLNGVGNGKANSLIHYASYGVLIASFMTLSYCEYLRWTISGTIPMTNGYETMLFVAWIVQAVSIVMGLRLRIMLTFGFLMSGFFLLVSHISQMSPQITHTMPVLNSPLLGIHVSVIMMGFALLSLTFICALTAFVVLLVKRTRAHREVSTNVNNDETPTIALQKLSLLLLYPAMTALGIGIFIGAIWANVSWGEYWGWDPKEVWALITFMVYAAALHPKSVPALQRPTTYHTFMLCAFLTIIITYFGVNYILGGAHSYA